MKEGRRREGKDSKIYVETAGAEHISDMQQSDTITLKTYTSK